jgi:Na+/H+-dicarboxylate symporter
MVLSKTCIAQAVTNVEEFFEDSGISGRDQIRLRLLIENALLTYQSRLGEDAEFEMIFRKMGVHKVVIRVRGESIDPFEDVHEDDDYPDTIFLKNLFELGTAKAYWSYHRGSNVITASALKGERAFRIPGGAITVASILGFIAALITKGLPSQARTFLIDDFSAPLLSKLLGLIILVTGPLIFFSVVSGICAFDDLSSINKLGGRVIYRFLRISSGMIVFAMAVCFLFFPGLSGGASAAFSLSTVVKMLLELIPQDLVSPFVEGKMIQVIVLAALTGAGVVILGEGVPRIRELIAEANQLTFRIMELVSKIIPLAVFLSIYKSIASNSFNSFRGSWKIIAANYMILLFCEVMLIWITVRNRVSPREFLQKGSPVFMLAFLTGSSTLAMNKNFEVCINNYQFDEKLCDFYIPISHALFSPSTVFPLVVAAFYASEYSGAPISAFQLLIVFILVIQLSVASPKVPGGIMATFTILLNQLGLPLDAVGMLMVANVFCVNMDTAIGMVIRDLDLLDLNAHM